MEKRCFKKLLTYLIICYSTTGYAQDIYQVENMISRDLNGTARFVGMGGAMSALGADLSTMGTNPAGTGMYRSSDVAATFSIGNQIHGNKFDGQSPTVLSFDEIGFVYSAKIHGNNTLRFFNIGFNYHKRKNFNQLLDINQNNPTQSSQTYLMADLLWNAQGDYYLIPPYVEAGVNNNLIVPIYDDKTLTDVESPYAAKSYLYKMASSGGIEQYDFNFSCNLSDRFYIGLTIGAYNVNIDSYSEYSEELVDENGVFNGQYTTQSIDELSGNGFDVKLGAIVLPFENSPLRIGLAVSTPTYFDLHSKSYNRMYWSDNPSAMQEFGHDYYYQLKTPWKVNISIGHTLWNRFAVGAEYEYSDYSSASISYEDDWYGDEITDHGLKKEINNKLKGVSTFKVGAEIKIIDGFSLRGGYNYISKAFEKNAFRDQFIDSPSTSYATSSNYMNLSDINRFTCGFGYRGKHLYADFAYQYQNQEGSFYPYKDLYETPYSKVNLDKQQFLLTLGYKF